MYNKKMNRREFQTQLLEWYQENQRPLPFRQNKDAYRIWISEIMAQQTRIEAMLTYFQRFVEELPDIPSLAAVSEKRLNKLWQGLGYYSRARNLKKCAQVCMEEYEGHLPETKQELMKLPGIGPYTAGAIASIAFDEVVTAVDGNVIRVFSRLLDDDGDMTKAKNKKRIEQAVQETLPDSESISDFNQALMELGALICLPQSPRCISCPVRSHCQTKHPESLPVMNKKKERKIEQKEIYLLVHEDKIHIRKRPQNGLLAGLYGFDETCPTDYNEKIQLEPYTHIFSHVEWQMNGYIVWVDHAGKGFHTLEEIHEEYAIPGAFQPFLTQAERIIYERSHY